MTSALFNQIETEGAIVDLSDRAKWQLSGSDRIRYLNGQVTNDVRTANSETALYACVTDVKGRIVGDISVHSAEEILRFDAEAELREILGPRLERYIIADDAELTDITDEWQLWHVFGASALASAAAWQLPEGTLRLTNDRLGEPGLDLWIPATAKCPVPQFAQSMTLADFESLRITRSIPRYPQELGPTTFPAEAGLESKAMSFTKGCYIGQEVLSRIKTTGKMPRTLVRWQANERVQAGDEWFPEDSEQAIGHATSVVFHPLQQQWVGLGYVKQAITPKDSGLIVRNGQPRIGPIVEIFALPK